MHIFTKTNTILLRVIPYVLILLILKLLFHQFHWEFITVNAMFSGIIGANVFLVGFLLTGVISDFKESEKLPGELAGILETISDELEMIDAKKQCSEAKEALLYLSGLGQAIHAWMYQRIPTAELMTGIKGLNHHYSALEPYTQANFIARLKQEQNMLRKLIIRINTIRETDFVSSGYLIAVTTSLLLFSGLLLSRIEPFSDALFFIGVISYMLIFLLFLIRDLDNPFGYSDKFSSEDVSLQPLEDSIHNIKTFLEKTA